MSKVKEDSYIFCASIIRASENTLLPEAELVRAAEADTFQGAMAVLKEHGFSDGKALERPRDFVKLLNEEEEKAYELSSPQCRRNLNWSFSDVLRTTTM